MVARQDYTGFAEIGAMRGMRSANPVHLPVNRARGKAIQFGYGGNLVRPLRALTGQTVQPLPQLQQRIGGDLLTSPR